LISARPIKYGGRTTGRVDGIPIETLNTVFERTSTAMLLIDGDRRFRDCNEAACEALGRTRDELLELHSEDVLAPERLPLLEARWQELIAKGRSSGRTLLLNGDGAKVKAYHLSVANFVPGRHLAVIVPVDSDQEGLDWLLEEDGAGSDGSGDAPERAPLTPREREIITLLALGLTGEEIADKLVISPETVRIHVRNARRRLGAKTRAHAVALAIKGGQIEL
jgi:PAS domain S-box-containing protein